VKKRSPRGLFNINEMAFNISSEDWVLTCIEDGEVWARTTLEKAGIQIAAGSELSLTSKRSTADPVHQAAVTLFQARKLREWLKQSQDAGGLASWQAFQSAFRMGQFLFAAFSGTLIEVEPLLDTGRKVRFGGQDGARAASENIHENSFPVVPASYPNVGTGVIPANGFCWYRRHTQPPRFPWYRRHTYLLNLNLIEGRYPQTGQGQRRDSDDPAQMDEPQRIAVRVLGQSLGDASWSRE
jgi:hypothetical protein